MVMVLVTDANEWNFESAFSTAASVIPTLLLAVVLQKELLPVATAFAARFREGIKKPPSRLLEYLLAVSPFSSIRLTVWTLRPSVVVGLAVIAELLALFGVAQPAGWRAENPGRLIAFGSLGLIAFVILELLLLLMIGLLAVATAAEVAKAGPKPQPEADEGPHEDTA
jgi:hypothetical protein